MIISLIGYRATGKSTIGRKLAKELQLPFFDSDQVIVQQAGRSIANIFEEDGEAEFRKIESAVVADLTKQKDAVIAWGGGVILSEINCNLISRSQIVFWLRASAENILQRMEHDPHTQSNRPALTELDQLQEIQHLLDSRADAYQRTATQQIETDGKSADEIVMELTRIVKSDM